MKTSSESFQQDGPKKPNEPAIVRSTRKAGEPISPEMLEQLNALRDMPDDEIDFSDIPPTTPDFWRKAIQRKALDG